LEDNLLRRMLEALLRKPTQMSAGPMLKPSEDPTVTEQESHQLLPLFAQIVGR
jgi:hypothetical protein